MNSIDLDKKNIDLWINSSDVIIIDYWADFCGPCKALAPVLEEMSTKYSIKVGKVDLVKDMETASKFKVMNIPCLIVFKEGKEVERMVGFKGRESVENLFKKYT